MNERATPDPPIHPQMQLLPWFLSGTLHEVERQQVTAHLAHCHVCRAELESLTLMRRILRDSFAESKPRLPGRTVVRAGAVLACCVIGLQLAMIIRLWTPRPVTAPTATTQGRPLAGTRLRFVANPDARAQPLEEFLRSVAARIVAGPDGEGSYVVEIPTIDPGRVAQTLAALQSHPEIAQHVSVATVE